MAAVSEGSATASRNPPSGAPKGKMVDSRRNRREKPSRRGVVVSSCGRLSRGSAKKSDTSSANSAAERSVASQNSRNGRMSAGLADLSTGARARGDSEYFPRRCCRKLSAERSRIAFTALTLLLECNSFEDHERPFTL